MTSRGIRQSVGVSSRKGEHFPFLHKNGAHKNKACDKGSFLIECCCMILHRMSAHFIDELNMWRDRDYYSKHVRRLQLPFTVTAKPPPVDPEVLKMRRQEMAKRLVEMNARKREERLQEDKANLKVLLSAQTLSEQGSTTFYTTLVFK